jgi:putative polyhydroxyalkanoate system protein
MPNLTASIPHQMARADAKCRIQEQVGVLRQQHGSMFSELKETWVGDRMDFAATAMGQSISGNLTVDDHAIHVVVALPWLLSMLAGTVKQRIEQQVAQVLALPAAATSASRK